MNELAKTTSAISNCSAKEVAPQIMTICRTITPQFYKGMSDMDVAAEKLGIELMISNIDQHCLAEMCRLAVLNYPRFRSENPKTYFDVNYILTFYKQAFNQLYCDLIELPKKSQLKTSSFNNETNILTEVWETPSGEEVKIREICEPSKKSYERVYSKKFYQSCISDIDELEI